MKVISIADVMTQIQERLTNYVQDTAATEHITPAAVASRVANDPELLRVAVTYERPAAPPAAKPSATPAATPETEKTEAKTGQTKRVSKPDR